MPDPVESAHGRRIARPHCPPDRRATTRRPRLVERPQVVVGHGLYRAADVLPLLRRLPVRVDLGDTLRMRLALLVRVSGARKRGLAAGQRPACQRAQ
jgi:hypothetical protein